MTRLQRKLSQAVTAAAAIVAVSCGGGVQSIPESGASLEGTVTYGDQKVPFALVIAAVSGPGGGSASGNCDEDGHYKLSNVPLGTVKIAVNSDAAMGEIMNRTMAGVDPTKKGSKLKPITKVDLPKKYFDPDSSGLTTVVNKGSNTFDIQIKK